jgi:predicted secreted protein
MITKNEYEELKKYKEVDKELLTDIARGIKDILQEKIKEI